MAHPVNRGGEDTTVEMRDFEEFCSAFSGVVGELEEGEIERQFFWGDSAMRSQPRPEQGRVAFHHVDVDFAKPIAVVVASRLLLSVIDREVLVASFLQSRIDVVLVGTDRGAQSDRRLLHILQHVKYDLTSPLNHAQDWWLLFRQSAPSTIPFQLPPTTLPAFSLTASGCP